MVGGGHLCLLLAGGYSIDYMLSPGSYAKSHIAE